MTEGEWRGKLALVTGGNRGIGLATARAFARRGADVLLAARDREAGEAAAAEIAATGVHCRFLAVDVSNGDELAAVATEIERSHGGLDFACNCAGVAAPPARLAECDEAQWRRVLDVNLTGTWLSMKHELPLMLGRPGASIVNVASRLGLTAEAWGLTPYIASKHGVVGITRAAALEYSRDGVRVNAVCPAFVRTAMIEPILASTPEGEAPWAELHPLGRIAEPEEIAAAVVWLCSEEASFVTGVALPVDGGCLAR